MSSSSRTPSHSHAIDSNLQDDVKYDHGSEINTTEEEVEGEVATCPRIKVTHKEIWLLQDVIQRMFSFMDRATLLSCRASCSNWMKWSGRYLAPKSEITLNKPKVLFTPKELMEFSIAPDTLWNFPIGKARFLLKGEDAGTSCPDTTQFISSYGPSFKSFVIFVANGTPGSTLSNFLIRHFPSSLRNVEFLSLINLSGLTADWSPFEESPLECIAPMHCVRQVLLTLSDSSLHGDPERTMAFLGKLLQKLPNLIKINTNFQNSETLLIKFYRILQSLGLNRQLREVTLARSNLGNDGLEFLAKVPFPQLTGLRIDTLQGNWVGPRLTSFLQTLARTLETLILEGEVGGQSFDRYVRERERRGMDLMLPKMERLTVLRNWNVEGYRVGPIKKIMSQLPQVKTLELKNFGTWAIGQFSPFRQHFPLRLRTEPKESFDRLKDLRISCNFRPNRKNLQGLSGMITLLPGLTSLEVSVSVNEGGRLEGCLKLLARVSNGGLRTLAMGFQDCRQLWNAETAVKFNQILGRKLAAFQNVQKLSLTLVDMPEGSQAKLTSEAVVNGLLKMKELTSLYLTGFRFEDMEMETLLREKLSVLIRKDAPSRLRF